MLIIDAAQTRGVLTIPRAAGIVADTYRGISEGRVRASSPSSMVITMQPQRINTKGAVLLDLGIAGIRLTSKAAPRILLWSLESGEPIALIDESWLYPFRTGISAAVVARWLVPQGGAERVAVIGAGPIAMAMAEAIHHLLQPREIAVAARRETSARDFANRAQASGIPARAAEVASATEGADLIVTITTASEELISLDRVKRGATVLSMGGALEVGHGVWAAASARFVDDIGYALRQGDAASWVAAGILSAQDFEKSLTGTIGDVAAGRWPGRAGPGETVMAIVQGTTALDLALAHVIYQHASA